MMIYTLDINQKGSVCWNTRCVQYSCCISTY